MTQHDAHCVDWALLHPYHELRTPWMKRMAAKTIGEALDAVDKAKQELNKVWALYCAARDVADFDRRTAYLQLGKQELLRTSKELEDALCELFCYAPADITTEMSRQRDARSAAATGSPAHGLYVGLRKPSQSSGAENDCDQDEGA